jgi:hypothetical protein
MLRSRIGVWKLLALVAVVLLIQAHTASSVMVASTQGRDMAACVQACNVIRDACVLSCGVDCALLYPPGLDYDVCWDECNVDCQEEKQTCKAKCNVNRYPPCPTEP